MVTDSVKESIKNPYKMIYIDPPQVRFVKRRGEYLRTSHLISDNNVEELHAFVAEMGLSRRGFHDKPGQPHYDLLEGMVEEAVAHGAKQVNTREIIRLLKQRYGSNM